MYIYIHVSDYKFKSYVVIIIRYVISCAFTYVYIYV